MNYIHDMVDKKKVRSYDFQVFSIWRGEIETL